MLYIVKDKSTKEVLFRTRSKSLANSFARGYRRVSPAVIVAVRKKK